MRAAVLAVLALAPLAAACDAKPAAATSEAAPPATQAAPTAPALPTGPLVEAPAGGDVATMVRNTMAIAAQQKRKVIVYVGATWCKPCQRFHKALESGRLDAALADVAFLAFDYDRDHDRLRGDGYASQSLPLFAVPAPDGAPSGRQIEGGIPDDSAVDDLVARIHKMLAES